MALVRADIATIVVAGGPMASLLILKPRAKREQNEALPLHIGSSEAMAIGLAIDPTKAKRPQTHDLIMQMLTSFGALIKSVAITDVKDTTFYAYIEVATPLQEETIRFDARPSDAVALAVRARAPIYVEERVIDVAGYPDFDTAKREAQKDSVAAFDKFVENLSPEDFNSR